MDNPVTDQVLSYLDEVALHLDSLLPWVKHLNTAERVELLADLTQAWAQCRQTGDMQALINVLEEWQATAEALTDPDFMQAWRQPYDPTDYVPWEQVRGELDLSRDPEAGRP